MRYLTTGAFLESWELGHSFCRHNCETAKKNPVVMGCTTLTDGVWVWPEGLAHYLQDHYVTLPETFVLHVLQTLHKATGGMDEQVISLKDARMDDWIERLDDLLPVRNHINWVDGGPPCSLPKDLSQWLRSRTLWLQL